MRAFPGEHAYVATQVVLKKQRPQLVAHEASECLFGWKRLEFFRVNSRILCEPFERDFENFKVQTILAFEMIVDGSLVDPSLGDDVTHARSLEPLFREQR